MTRACQVLSLALGSIVLAIWTYPATAAPFTTGNVVVLQVGNGVDVFLGDDAAPVVLKEFTTVPDAPPVQEIVMPNNVDPLPVGENHKLTLGYGEFRAGVLTQSVDGRYLTLIGYDADLYEYQPAATYALEIPRVIGRIDKAGTVDTTTAISDYVEGCYEGDANGGPRSVVTTDGIKMWLSGRGNTPSNNVRFTTYGSTTSIRINNSSTYKDVRYVNVFNGQLYATYNISGHRGVYVVGTGLPETCCQPISKLLDLKSSAGANSPYGFCFIDSRTAYLADDQMVSAGGGLQRFNYEFDPVSQTEKWVYKYTLKDGLLSQPDSQAIKQVAGTRGPDGNPVLYVITAEIENPGTQNRLMMVTDTGTGTDAFVPLQTAPPYTIFRGVALAPPCGTTRQDVDGDGDVDVADFAVFQVCFNGPGNPYSNPPGPAGQSCMCFDEDRDLDVDVNDFAVFQVCFNGPARPPSC